MVGTEFCLDTKTIQIFGVQSEIIAKSKPQGHYKFLVATVKGNCLGTLKYTWPSLALRQVFFLKSCLSIYILTLCTEHLLVIKYVLVHSAFEPFKGFKALIILLEMTQTHSI